MWWHISIDKFLFFGWMGKFWQGVTFQPPNGSHSVSISLQCTYRCWRGFLLHMSGGYTLLTPFSHFPLHSPPLHCCAPSHHKRALTLIKMLYIMDSTTRQYNSGILRCIWQQIVQCSPCSWFVFLHTSRFSKVTSKVSTKKFILTLACMHEL